MRIRFSRLALMAVCALANLAATPVHMVRDPKMGSVIGTLVDEKGAPVDQFALVIGVRQFRIVKPMASGSQTLLQQNPENAPPQLPDRHRQRGEVQVHEPQAGVVLAARG